MTTFYVCKFENLRYKLADNKTFIKFGITRHADPLDRFNPAVDDRYSKNYSDWQITVLYSRQLPKALAEEEETYWLGTRFPVKSKYKVWVERELKCRYNDEYSTNTGITELRLLLNEEVEGVIRELHEREQNGRIED